MDALLPGRYWKTHFIWEPGCPEPSARSSLQFAAAHEDWLRGAVAQVMSNSLDESDRYAVARAGASQAVTDLFAFDQEHFEKVDGWWSVAIDGQDNHPMVSAFRKAGYKERSSWQRPVA